MKKIEKGIIEINIQFKEKNCSRQDYRSIASAWLKSQALFRDSLKQLEDQERLSHNLAWKLYKVFNTSDIDYKLKKLQLLERVSNPKDSNVVSQTPTSGIPASKTILPSFTKNALKEKIIELAKHQEQPNYNYDALIKSTSELLNHPDLTDNEKYRYSIYYSELIEYRNYKLFEKEKINQSQHLQPLNQDLSTYSTSISQIRNKMTSQLQKLRETYNIDDQWKISRI
jgi:hypothetical protein